MQHWGSTRICAILLLILLGVAVLSLFLGPTGFALFSSFDSHQTNSILIYRGTRIFLAIIAGSSLAASGASLQAIFRNPLADPHIFGISGGAAVGASIAIAFLAHHGFAPSAGAIIGGLCAFLLLFAYLRRAPSASLGQCLLVGILINSLAASLITVLKSLVPMDKTQSLLFWLIGHITVIEPAMLLFIVPLWLLGLLALFAIKGELEVLSFGIDEGKLLGINADYVIRMAIAANCILIGNIVSFAGMIGFIGLVVPHLVRLLLSANLFIALPIAAIGGAIVLVFFDTLSRMSFFVFGSELPVGALSALILSPVFFFLLVRDERHGRFDH